MEENTNTENTNTERASSFMIPGAIIIAGLFIAGAIVASNGIPTGGTRAVVKAPENLGSDLYMSIAKDLDLEVGAFTACLEDDRYETRVQRDFDDALAAGGTGTPYNIVINVNGRKAPFSGAVPYSQLAAIVTEALLASDTFGNNNSAAAANMRPIDETDHVRGNPNAPVTLVEYSDLECPFCARHHPNMIRLLDEFDGDVKWVYRHFPLTSIHPDAFPSALASECAAEVGGEDAFWSFVDEIFDRTS